MRRLLLNRYEPLLRQRRLLHPLLLRGRRLGLWVICLLKRLRGGSIIRLQWRVRGVASLLQGMRRQVCHWCCRLPPLYESRILPGALQDGPREGSWGDQLPLR